MKKAKKSWKKRILEKVEDISGEYIVDQQRNTSKFFRPLRYHIVELRNLSKIKKIEKLPLVSIIIPCYNSSFITETIASIRKQKYKNLEIIIVDDGSTIPMEETIKKVKDKRIKYFRKENGGPSSARNMGIEMATGKYIYFLDADDFLYIGAIANLVLFALKNGLDVASGLIVRRESETNVETYWYFDLYKKRRIAKLADERELFYKESLCTNKLYKKDFLDKKRIRFKDGIIYEDKVFTSEVYIKLNEMGILNKVVYIWRVEGENSSITTSKTVLNFIKRTVAVKEQLSIISSSDRRFILSLFCNHDFVIYAREYMNYSNDDKKLLFDTTRDFLLTYGEYLDSKHVTSKEILKCVNYSTEGNFNAFDEIAQGISEEYKKNK